MRRVLAIVFAAALSGCADPEPPPAPPRPDPLQSMRQQLEATRAELENEKRRSALQQKYIDEATQTINSVEEQLSSMSSLESRIRKGGVEAEQRRLSPSVRKQLLAGIASMREQLKANTRALDDFQSRTAQYPQRITSLEQALDRLRRDIQRREKDIVALRGVIAGMRQEVANLEKERDDGRKTIEQQEVDLGRTAGERDAAAQELRTAHVIIGTTSRLAELKVLDVKKPIFRRRRVALRPDFPRDVFSPVDIESTKEFDIDALPVRVVVYPPRDAKSYLLKVHHPAGQTKLTVVDATSFWRYRYLIIAID